MQPTQPVPKPASAPPDKWTCPSCNMRNAPRERKCFICDTVKPNDPELERQALLEKMKKERARQEAQERVKKEFEGQGWACTNCNGISAMDVFECHRCGGIRPYKTPEEKQALVMYLKAKKARLAADIASSAVTESGVVSNVSFPSKPETPNSHRTSTSATLLKPVTATATDGSTFTVGEDLQKMVVPAPHSGTLKVQDDGVVFKTFKERYCELRGPYLYTFKVKDDTQPKCRIVLNEPGTQVIEEESTAKHRFRIHCVETNKDYVFMDTNPDSYKTWIAKLREAIEAFAGRETSSAGLYVGERGDFQPLILFPTNNPLSRARYALEDFELLQLIGKGSFGKVLKVRNKVTGEIMAMKVLRKEAITKPKEVLAEKAVLQVVDHPFIVKLFGAFQTHSKLFLVMGYLSGGDMKLHLRVHAPFPEERARFYAAQIVMMFECLHVNRIVYRDLKPDNLVLDAQGYAVLTDMGLARDMTDSTVLRTFCGTPLYMAPELVDKKGYDSAVDWWAFGIIIYEMMVGVTPFSERTIQGVFNLLRTTEVQFPESMSAEAKDLLSKILVKDPKRRLSNAQDIKCHPFFAGVNWEKLEERKLPAPAHWKPPSESAPTESVMITPEQAARLIQDDRQGTEDAIDPYLGFTFCDVKPSA